jgi:pyridoxamine 5'-phosphate oxidase
VAFHWDHTERQARLTGFVEPTSPEESDAYFATRQALSKLGAWASRQSEPLSGTGELLDAVRRTMKDLGIGPLDLLRKGEALDIPRPRHWGGYRLWIERLELWCASKGRLHDRGRWTREVIRAAGDEPTRAAAWSMGSRTRLYP